MLLNNLNRVSETVKKVSQITTSSIVVNLTSGTTIVLRNLACKCVSSSLWYHWRPIQPNFIKLITVQCAWSEVWTMETEQNTQLNRTSAIYKISCFIWSYQQSISRRTRAACDECWLECFDALVQCNSSPDLPTRAQGTCLTHCLLPCPCHWHVQLCNKIKQNASHTTGLLRDCDQMTLV